MRYRAQLYRPRVDPPAHICPIYIHMYPRHSNAASLCYYYLILLLLVKWLCISTEQQVQTHSRAHTTVVGPMCSKPLFLHLCEHILGVCSSKSGTYRDYCQILSIDFERNNLALSRLCNNCLSYHPERPSREIKLVYTCKKIHLFVRQTHLYSITHNNQHRCVNVALFIDFVLVGYIGLSHFLIWYCTKKISLVFLLSLFPCSWMFTSEWLYFLSFWYHNRSGVKISVKDAKIILYL